ncbi:MAG: DNA recombination protein RmuC [Proteobacteria bacterium]|nr:DNA recombination protein RmuC [Pseudomonadota bacterium]
MSLALGIVLAVVCGLLAGAALVYGVAFAVKKKSDAELIQAKEELKGQFASVAQEALTQASDQFLKLASSRLETQQVKSKAELDENRQAVENAVAALGERLKAYEEHMKSFEKDREKKYGSLEEQLRKAVSTTERLQTTTDGLQSMLSNSRTRGQWGERMAEDILRAAGLQETVQYVKNRAQDTVSTRPDYTFFLPDDRKFHMDVKFPLDNYMRMVNAQGDEERARFRAEFLRDARARVKEIQKRDYINPDEKTLDYVLLFIPNEQVYSYLHEAAPGLLDEALAQKVVMCSPFTLYAVLAVIRQAYDNFHFSEATQEIVRLIGSFQQAYEKFKERFDKLGEQLGKTSELYQDIAVTSYKRLDQAIARIERVRKGEEVVESALPPPSPRPTLPAS